jgi:hypothetical protein
VGGFRHSHKPEDLAIFLPSVYTDATLPAKVDLRPYMTKVEDQGQVRTTFSMGLAYQ